MHECGLCQAWYEQSAHRQHPLLLGPHSRAERPGGAAHPAVKQGAPVLWPILFQCIHVVYDIQQAAVLGTVDYIIQRVGLLGVPGIPLQHSLEGNILCPEQVALVERGCWMTITASQSSH